MKTVQYILKRLEELGVEHFFGHIGKYNLNIINEIESNPAIQWINCTNVQNSVFASDGYARIKGFGAFVTSYGSQELNTLSAITASMEENIPIICISGIQNSVKCDDNSIEIFKKIVPSYALLTKDNAKLEIDRVLKTFVKERKPVYIAVPENLTDYELADRDITYDWLSDDNVLEETVSNIIEKIKSSAKPSLLCGSLIKRFSSIVEYKEFVEKSAIPVFSLRSGINITNADLPAYLGLYTSENEYIKLTDLCIVIGALQKELNEIQNIKNQIIISGNYTVVDGKKYEIKMSELLNSLTKTIEFRRFEYNKTINELKPFKSSSDKISAESLCSRIQEYIIGNDIIISDSIIMQKCFENLKLPSSTNVESYKNNNGWATPAGFGANIAKQNARVIIITDSDSHIVSGMELGTIIKNGLKPIIIVIKKLLSEFDLPDVNFTKFARVFNGDIWSTQVETSEDFDKALKVTQIMNKMCYIEVCMECQDKIIQEKSFNETFVTETKDEKITNINLDKISLTSPISGNKYETTVHKVYDTTEEI